MENGERRPTRCFCGKAPLGLWPAKRCQQGGTWSQCLARVSHLPPAPAPTLSDLLEGATEETRKEARESTGRGAERSTQKQQGKQLAGATGEETLVIRFLLCCAIIMVQSHLHHRPPSHPNNPAGQCKAIAPCCCKQHVTEHGIGIDMHNLQMLAYYDPTT